MLGGNGVRHVLSIDFLSRHVATKTVRESEGFRDVKGLQTSRPSSGWSLHLIALTHLTSAIDRPCGRGSFADYPSEVRSLEAKCWLHRTSVP